MRMYPANARWSMWAARSSSTTDASKPALSGKPRRSRTRHATPHARARCTTGACGRSHTTNGTSTPRRVPRRDLADVVRGLAQSATATHVFCAPGNPGIAEVAERVPIAEDDVGGLIDFARTHGVDLSVVGPKAPLLDGIVDAFEAAGLAVFGPRRDAALLEGSKSFAKALMHERGIPTARSASFTDFDAALAHVRRHGAPVVIKADGLAAGKGVVVATDLAEAEAALRDAMLRRTFGDAGARVVVEERLSGEEVSLMAFVDGDTVRPMVPAQDHKPVFDGDVGPNTGGMGAYSPVPRFGPREVAHAMDTILGPVARAMTAAGRPLRGVLYAGLMLTDQGPAVIEFNVRFGDPEAQVVLPRLDGDLAQILHATATGRLDEVDVAWRDEAAVCIVMASAGYPGPYAKGVPIDLPQVAPSDRAVVFHAGTETQDGRVVTRGGRVLGVTGIGADVADARAHAEALVRRVHFEGAHSRSDIAWRAVRR
ncbi:MAG: phosphoribosylamine--glycine ligase [Trueperaceae bacterium]|nr:phosphoribosylamine--glycine ligase [Trueperaceae bacterium]